MDGLTEALLKSGKPLRGRACRVDLANQREESAGASRIAAGNWREGHQVVEGRPRMDRPVMARAPEGAPMGAPAPAMGNWRETAQPVFAEAAPRGPPREGSFRPSADLSSGEAMARGGGGKPVLNLLPRTAPVASDEGARLAATEYQKSSKPNPFGSARPRELVLSKKEQDETKEEAGSQ